MRGVHQLERVHIARQNEFTRRHVRGEHFFLRCLVVVDQHGQLVRFDEFARVTGRVLDGIGRLHAQKLHLLVYVGRVYGVAGGLPVDDYIRRVLVGGGGGVLVASLVDNVALLARIREPTLDYDVLWGSHGRGHPFYYNLLNKIENMEHKIYIFHKTETFIYSIFY